jgi:hypothetical protein
MPYIQYMEGKFRRYKELEKKKQLKLYSGGFGAYNDITAATTEKEAIKNIGSQLNIQALPVTVKEIKLAGFDIVINKCS